MCIRDRRATLWMMELKQDLDDLDYVLGSLRLLGSKGTTGTQASFLELFDGDHAKCRKVDQMIAEKMGFDGCYPVSGQTYSRKQDTRAVSYTHLDVYKRQAPGGHHHPCGYHHRGGRREERHGDGPQVYRALWPCLLYTSANSLPNTLSGVDAAELK